MRFFLQAYRNNGLVFKRGGLEFSSKEASLTEIIEDLRAILLEYVNRGDDVPFTMLNITDDSGVVVRKLVLDEGEARRVV